ncbi:hypothetical protein HDU89_005639 [Geranomyces variabilis]|nr:hypothetical protein HDU89_005639 [Geranomyces variabilis]
MFIIDVRAAGPDDRPPPMPFDAQWRLYNDARRQNTLVIAPSGFYGKTTVVSLLIREALRIKVAIVVFDEAQHAVGRHPYVQIAYAIGLLEKKPQLFALCQSPLLTLPGKRLDPNTLQAKIMELAGIFNASTLVRPPTVPLTKPHIINYENRKVAPPRLLKMFEQSTVARIISAGQKLATILEIFGKAEYRRELEAMQNVVEDGKSFRQALEDADNGRSPGEIEQNGRFAGMLQALLDEPMPNVVEYSPRLKSAIEYLINAMPPAQAPRSFAGVLFISAQHIERLCALFNRDEHLQRLMHALKLSHTASDPNTECTVDQFNAPTSRNLLLIASFKATEGLDFARCTHFILYDSTKDGRNPCLYLQCCARATFLQAQRDVIDVGATVALGELHLSPVEGDAPTRSDSDVDAHADDADDSSDDGTQRIKIIRGKKTKTASNAAKPKSDSRALDETENTPIEYELFGEKICSSLCMPRSKRKPCNRAGSGKFIAASAVYIVTRSKLQGDSVEFSYHSGCVGEDLWAQFKKERRYLVELHGFAALDEVNQNELSRISNVPCRLDSRE